MHTGVFVQLGCCNYCILVCIQEYLSSLVAVIIVYLYAYTGVFIKLGCCDYCILVCIQEYLSSLVVVIIVYLYAYRSIYQAWLL